MLIIGFSDVLKSQQPYRLLIAALEDQAPVVSVRLRSIGSAITADARLPIVGEITDDFGVDHASFVVETDGGNSRDFPIEFVEGEPVDTAIRTEIINRLRSARRSFARARRGRGNVLLRGHLFGK